MFELKDIYDYFNQEYRFKENIVFDGASIDTRTIRNNELFFAIKGKNFDGNEYVDVAFDKGALGAITNKNVVTKKDKVFIKKVDNVLSELHNFAAYIRKKYDFKVVAVTGSAGKTTTKDMIAHILGKHYNVKKSHKSFNNDYGVPLTLLGMEKNDTHLILEIGANHIGEVEKLSKIASPDIAVITNIGYAHIGEFGSKDNILEAKSEIIQNINTNGIAIINGDDIKLREKVYSYSETKNINVITFGFSRNNDICIYDHKIIDNYTTGTIKINNIRYFFRIPLQGEHYLFSLMISVAVAMAYGIDPNVALEDTSDFKPPEGRNMIINCGKNLVIVDDTYNASPDAMINAIKNLRLLNADVSIAILGEMKELGEYSKYLHEMIGELAAKSIDYLICYGQDTRYIIDKVLQNGFDANNVFYTTSIKNSYEIAGEILHKNDKKKAILIKGGRFVHMERVCMTLLGEDVRCNKALCEKYIHCSTCENVKKES